MVFLPLYFEDERPSRCQRWSNYFDLGSKPQDTFTIIAVPRTNWERRTLRNKEKDSQEVNTTIKEDKNKFQVNLDVQHFTPEEISVKTIDSHVIVEAKHEEKQDEHGFITRSFIRKYGLPEGVDVDSVVSRLSSDGVLTITAEMKQTGANERIVPIVQTGPIDKQTSDITEDESKD